MIVQGIECLKCGTQIFSRARHDLRFCSCGNSVIDGGFDYKKVSVLDNPNTIREIEIEVNATEVDLYRDWAEGIDKYGLIKGEKNE